MLLRNPDVIPAALGLTGGPVFQQAHVYLTVAPPEAPRVLNDFWSTMKLPWRPAVQLVVTAPLDLLQDTPPGPPMTTLIERYAALGPGGTVDERIEIGGWVLRDADSTPIAGATVQRVVTGETATTDAQGRYIFTGLRRGIHRLLASAPGFTSLQRDLDIPTGPPADHIFRLKPRRYRPMPTTYVNTPGVQIQEVRLASPPIVGVSTSIAGFVGQAPTITGNPQPTGGQYTISPGPRPAPTSSSKSTSGCPPTRSPPSAPRSRARCSASSPTAAPSATSSTSPRPPIPM